MPNERRIVHPGDEKGISRSGGADARIAALAERQHGLVTRRQLLSLGLGRGAIDSRIRRGALHPVHRGVYAVGHRLVSRDGRAMAAVLVAGRDAALSRRSAGELWGILLPAAHLPEVARPGSCGGIPDIAVHRAILQADEIGTVRGIPVTSVPRTVLDLAAVLKRRQLERALNEVEVQRLWDALSLADLLERYPRMRGTATLRELLASRAPESVTRNDFEELFLALLDANGLPRPRVNATLPIRGRLLEVDFMWPAQRLIVELDGREVHGTRRAFESDRRRDRALAVEGWRSARVTWRQLRDEAPSVAADLRLLLTAPVPAESA
jgi:very-short-patch-repair endonuclease